MDKLTIAEGWNYLFDYVPSRVGAYMSVTNGSEQVEATVRGWLDENLETTTKKSAKYIKARKWGGRGLPTWFIIRLPSN